MIIDDLPDAPDPVLDPPKTFSFKAAAMVLALKKMVVQFKAAIAELNTWLAGGAYAIPYLIDPSTTMARPGGKYLRFNAAAQNTATLLALDLIGGDLKDYTSTLNSFSGSTSSVLGTIRLVKQGDTSKFLTFNITAVTTPGSWKQLAVTCIESSSASPFVSGDAIMLFFQRTGDMGPQGLAGSQLTSILHVREQYASGTAGPAVASGTSTCALNTMRQNSIPGVSLTSSQIVLPGGTYDIDGYALMRLTGEFRGVLHNVTDNAALEFGTVGSIGPNSYTDVAFSRISGRITLATQKTIELRRSANTSGTAGAARTDSSPEIYSEIIFRKVA